MKIAYLHGLESSIDPKDPKIVWMKENFNEIYTPSIDYRDPNAFTNLFAFIKAMKPDVIVGSSMGGYFSYLIGSKLATRTVLFNPAVIGRSFEPVVDDTKLRSTKHSVFLGKNDTVISGKAIKSYLESEGVGGFQYEIYKGGHRVPVDVFTSAIQKSTGITEIYNTNNIDKKMSKIKTFGEFVTEAREEVYHEYDFTGMQAQKLGMTREEFIAHYASPDIDEAKSIDDDIDVS